MNNKTSWGALEIADLCAGIVRHHHVTEQPSPEWNTIQAKYATRKREIVIPS